MSGIPPTRIYAIGELTVLSACLIGSECSSSLSLLLLTPNNVE